MSHTLTPEPKMPTDALPILHDDWDGVLEVRWNVRQFDLMFTSGLLDDGHYELMDGKVVSQMAQKDPHGFAVMTLILWLAFVYNNRQLITQCSLLIDDHNLPEPDIAVFSQRPQASPQGYLPAENLLLVIEVSSTTLARDRNVKAALYARANIPIYWVIDVNGRRAFVYTDPTIDGYQTITEFAEEDHLTLPSSGLPSLAVASLFLDTDT